MDSKEQKIIDQLVARLGEISVPNGYQTDIGANVADFQTHWDQNELPAISVYQGTVTSTPANDEGISVFRTMSVMIKCFLVREDTTAEASAFARKAISDIYAAIRSNDRWLELDGTPKATFTEEKQHGIEVETDSYEITGTQCEIEIQYLAQKFNMEL